MLEKPNDIVIDKENPFKNDKLKRKDSADNLTHLIQSTTQPFVLSINGPWGSGKTTFLKMWKADMENKGHQCIYFNAWENDFCDDPFFAFIAEIKESVDKWEIEKTTKDQINGIIKNLEKQSGNFIRENWLDGLNLMSKFQFGVGLNKESVDKIKKALKDFKEKAGEKKIKEYQKEREARESIKKDLRELANSIRGEGDEKKSPIVIFVDELDRCRPSYGLRKIISVKRGGKKGHRLLR